RLLTRAGAHIGGTYRAGRIHRTGHTFLRTGTGGGLLLGGLTVLHQRHQVCLVHLVQEVDSGFLVLVGPVSEDVEIVARLGGDGDELLVAAEIIHQGGVALRGQGRAVLGFLHHHIAVIGGVRRRGSRRRRVGALGKGGHRKAAHQHQAGAKGGKGSTNFLILHGAYPPVRNQREP